MRVCVSLYICICICVYIYIYMPLVDIMYVSCCRAAHDMLLFLNSL